MAIGRSPWKGSIDILTSPVRRASRPKLAIDGSARPDWQSVASFHVGS